MRALTVPLRLVKRAALAVRFCLALRYSWHLAWTKAER